jgi:hypothetical protein
MLGGERIGGSVGSGMLWAILAMTAALGLYEVNWGLPNGNYSWAADALGPLTVLSIVKHSTASWNSGWFYFKYPLGYPLLLLLVDGPYLGFLHLTGGFRYPQAIYPYGFVDPESALHTMALLGRGVSLACILGTVALTYDIGRRLFGRTGGLLAAWFVATAYPMVYYAHTTNLDAAYLFWLMLALWATVLAAETNKHWAYVVLGIAAAMAVSTKEQGFAFLLPLPPLIALRRLQASGLSPRSARDWWRMSWNRGTRAGLLATVITVVVANNVVYNPTGFVNRILYLSGRPLPGVTARLAPVEFGVFKGVGKEWQYATQLFDGIESSLGLPLLLSALVGAGYLLWKRRWWPAAYLFVPALTQYYLSLRTLDLIALRYTLPLSVILALSAAVLCAPALTTRARGVPALLVLGLCGLGLARATELDLVLRNDPRYQAEAWMRAHIPSTSTLEIYQKPVYLPRFGSMTVHEVALEQRTEAGIAERHPDFVVLSSAAKKGITHRWNPNWRQGRTLLVKDPNATAFLDALESQRLGYRVAARFTAQPTLLRLRITSLCPTITIFQRAPS